ncbi:hypothetical protein CVT24_003351 [Panaeolus cyanescens]|uniref:F-box domain-containing protein n=1 Tax=Panaeolus cyanescens TaxID=181874 RepID=A0A409Y785_9AGAR|nr:hypothetical protein CVT24_003351 [Panaeolus cyanescens]
MLHLLASGKSYASTATRRLHIGPFTIHRERTSLPAYLGIAETGESLEVGATFKKYFGKALSCFQNVESLSWIPTVSVTTDTNWVNEEVSEFLRNCATLQSFDLQENSTWDIPERCEPFIIPFEAMDRLTDITLSGLGGGNHFVLQQFASHITAYKQLKQITLLHGEDIDEPLQDLFGDLLSNYTTSHSPLGLTGITLQSGVPLPTASSMLHFQNLTQLTFRSGRSRIFGVIELDLTSLNAFYGALKDAGIQLQKINVKDTSPGLLSYLESYSGLKVLEIDVTESFGDLEVQTETQTTASQFFNAFKVHSASLECLGVICKWNGKKWTFDADNAVVWSKLLNLRRARTSVEGMGLNRLASDLPLLMETFLSLSKLQQLQIDCSDTDPTWMASGFEATTFNAIRAFIRTFKLPISKPRPMCIIFQTKTFEAIADSEGGHWVYHGDTLDEEFDWDENEFEEEEDMEYWGDPWDLDDELELEHASGIYYDDFDDEDFDGDGWD